VPTKKIAADAQKDSSVWRADIERRNVAKSLSKNSKTCIDQKTVVGMGRGGMGEVDNFRPSYMLIKSNAILLCFSSLQE
jgi:hypothetical protein